MQKISKNPMIQFREKAGRTDGRTDRQKDGRTDDTEFIRPHYRGSKMKFYLFPAKTNLLFNVYVFHPQKIIELFSDILSFILVNCVVGERNMNYCTDSQRFPISFVYH